MKERDQKIAELRKSMKVTKIDEYRVQLEVAETESLRLRRALDELIRTQENQRQYAEDSKEQEMELKRLKRQNNDLSTALNKKTRENEMLAEKLNEQKNEKRATSSSKQRKEHKDEVDQLKEEIDELKAKLRLKESEENEESVENESKAETIKRLKLQQQKHEELEAKHSREKAKVGERIEERNLLMMPIVEKAAAEEDACPMKQAVSENDLFYIRYEIRAKLILNSMNKEDFIKEIFRDYEESISISQLAYELSKDPLRLAKEDSETFARYVIEPRGEEEVKYSASRRKSVELAKESLEMALEIAYTFSSGEELNAVIRQTLEKVKGRVPRTEEEVDVEKWVEMFQGMDLDQIENDVLVSIGFENTRDVKRLSLKDLASKMAKTADEIPEDKSNPLENSEMEEPSNERKQEEKDELKDSQKEDYEEEDSTLQLDADFMASQVSKNNLDYISNTIMTNLAKHVCKENIEVRDLFQDRIFKKRAKVGAEQREFEVMKSQDFFAELRKINALPYKEGAKPLDIHRDLEQSLSAEECSDIVFVRRLQELAEPFISEAEDQDNMVRAMAEAVAVVERKEKPDKDEEYKDNFASEHGNSAPKSQSK